MNLARTLENARRTAPRIAATYAAAGIAGYAAMTLHIPLPWMMGALFATAAQALLGWRPRILPIGRRLGQFTIGIGVGLSFSQDAAASVASNLPAMTAAALLTLGAGALISFLLVRLTGIDRLTAVMSSVPGGPADMANLAERYGGDPLTVALAQTFRIALIVTVLPPLMLLSGIDGHIDATTLIIPVDLLGLTVLAAVAAAAVGGLTWLGLPNAWFLGALIAISGLTAGGVRLSGMPFGLIVMAQILLGSSLGITFDRKFLARSRRLLIGTIVCSVVLLLACGGIACLLSSVAGLQLASLIIALAPGGLPEMVLTAKALHLGVPMVTAFHVERVVLTLLLAPWIVVIAAKLTRHRQAAPRLQDAD